MAAQWFGFYIALPSCFKEAMREYKFEIFADYFTFDLDDSQNIGDSAKWEQKDFENLFAVGYQMISIATARNTFVPVTIEIRDEAPSDDSDEWDQVNEGSLEVPSGCLRVYSCKDPSSASHIEVTSGWYRVRIYYGNLDSLRENDREGNDHYKIVLWQAAYAPPQILKHRIKTLSSKLIQ
jgi:hypothetical protein